MYPKYDFRALISNPNTSEEHLVFALGKEPLQEVVRSWEYLNKNPKYLTVFSKGIQSAIERRRYPLFLLCYLTNYPEFKKPVLKGLVELWLTVKVYIGEQVIVGSECPVSMKSELLDVDCHNKLKMLSQLNTMYVNKIEYPIIYLPDAQEIIKWISTFQSV